MEPGDRDYVLGTHDEELERLGLQHEVWRPRAARAWRRAGFTAGQTLLDVGCGPGYAALDLAGIVGRGGRVVAIDRSRRFLDALARSARARGATWIEPLELDLDVDALPVTGADGAWSRWVYAFVSRPRELLGKVADALRPGGRMALHEYVDYRAWRLSPRRPEFEEFVAEVMASWRDAGGEPDIALDLPRWLEALGFEVTVAETISEVARPDDFVWQWPKAFLATGLQRLVDLGRVEAGRARAMREAFDEVERTPGAFMLTPTVLEIVARKP
jgi:SAM-dependent methyltransferase